MSNIEKAKAVKGKGKAEVSPCSKDKKRGQENIIEEEGEYGYIKNDLFHSLSNFTLKCEGVVEEKGEIVGYIVRARIKNNRNENVENW
jgi:hypothetical protein